MGVNVSRVIHSTRLGCRTIGVIRTFAEWQGGEFVTTGSKSLTVRGILTISRAKDLQQMQEGDRLAGGIRLLTTVPVYQTGAGNISDVVLFAGAKFKVLSVTPDHLYGFYRSELTRLEGDGIA